MLPLLPLPPNDCPTVGGVRQLRVWPASNVRLPAYTGVRLTMPLIVLDPQNYADIWFLPDSAGFEEPENFTEQGDFYKPSLQLVVSKDDPDLMEAIERLRAVRQFVAVYRDANGQVKLVGTPQHPLRFAAGLETGKRPGERNGYPLSFTGQTPRPAPFYSMLLPGTAPLRRAFSAGFSFGFK